MHLPIGDLIEVLCAAHLSSYVESPFQERGGIMIVGPPATLKTTAAQILETQYPDAVSISDINAKGLIQLRDAIASGTIRTLVIPELAKLYQRHVATASNVEGTLQALTGEGFAAASFEDQRVNRQKARATVIACLTPSTQSTHFTAWEESGFNRRFLWSLIRLNDPLMLEKAVIDWQKIALPVVNLPRIPALGAIPNLTTADDRRHLHRWVKYQPGGNHALHIQLLSKVVSVLRWWTRELNGRHRDPMLVVEAFAHSLGREGAELTFPESTRRGAVKPRVSTHRAAQTLARARWPKRGKKK